MENQESSSNKLGEEIKTRRMARGWSITDAANAAGLHRSYWGRLEQGYYQEPSPSYLQRVAEVLEIAFEDLYALAGYTPPEQLPSFGMYLRSGTSLPPNAIRELEGYFEFLRNQYGIPKDQPVFPPKPKTKPGKTQRPSDNRRAA